IRKFVRSPTSTAAFLLSQVKLDRDQRDPVCVRKVIDNIWMTLASSHDSGHSPLRQNSPRGLVREFWEFPQQRQRANAKDQQRTRLRNGRRLGAERIGRPTC